MGLLSLDASKSQYGSLNEAVDRQIGYVTLVVLWDLEFEAYCWIHLFMRYIILLHSQ